MPELPEVETVARGLDERLSGRTITGINVRWERSVGAPDPRTFDKHLVGQTITGVRRRGKWIVMDLRNGDELLIHLRMTGQLLVEPAGAPDGDYTRVLLHLDDDHRLRFSDMRKFGRLILTHDANEVLGDLGPEPLAEDFTVERFRQMLATRRARIKSLLLNQRFLAGLGNIYVNEALWQARIHPLRPANTLSAEEAGRLYGAICSVLRAAIEAGGTTLDNGNFKQANGEAGEFVRQLEIYGREGEPCACCEAPIERITVGQRGTYFCPCCQEVELSEEDGPR
jgi:formamidopyrimidine-DNA glycosylase